MFCTKFIVDFFRDFLFKMLTKKNQQVSCIWTVKQAIFNNNESPWKEKQLLQLNMVRIP